LRSGVRQLFEGIRQDQKRIALASSAKEGELKTYKIIADIDDLTKAENIVRPICERQNALCSLVLVSSAGS
jgi:hypothetical protein